MLTQEVFDMFEWGSVRIFVVNYRCEGRNDVMDCRARLRNESGRTSGYQIVLWEFWKGCSRGRLIEGEERVHLVGSLTSVPSLRYINYTIREKYSTNIKQFLEFYNHSGRKSLQIVSLTNLILIKTRKKETSRWNSIIHRYRYRYFLRNSIPPSSLSLSCNLDFFHPTKIERFLSRKKNRERERESAMESRSSDLINVPDWNFQRSLSSSSTNISASLLPSKQTLKKKNKMNQRMIILS